MESRRRRTFMLLSMALVVGVAGTAWWLFGRERRDQPKATLRSAGSVHAVAFSPDGRHLAVAGGRSVTLWERSTWQVVRRLEDPAADHVLSLAYSPDGTVLALGYGNGHVAVWDASRGERRLVLQEGKHKDSERMIVSLCFSPDGRSVAAAHHPSSWEGGRSSPSEVRLWDATTGKERMVLKGLSTLNSSDNRPDWVKAVVFSPDGTFLATGDMRGDVKLWNAADGRHLRDLPRRRVLALAFTPVGGTVAYGGEWTEAGDILTLCDLATGSETRFPGSPSNRTGTYVSYLAFTPDGGTLATGEILKDGKGPYRVRLWDVSTRQLVGVYWCERLVNTVAFSPDGTELAAGCEADGPEKMGEVRIWDVPPKHGAMR